MNRLLTIVDSKYQRLEYLESSGTQYIDTGISPNQNFSVKVKFSNSNSGTQSVVGLYNANSGYIWGIGQQSDNNLLFGQYYGGAEARITSNIQGNDGVARILELRKNAFYINDTLIDSKTAKTFSSNINIKLFTFNPSGSKASVKMYYCQIYNNDVLIRNFVPVLRKTDNELGMLDLVEGKFYTNAGTGKFTANLDTMYAIIQGSPTQSPYGVFSGFSASNYLKINNIDLNSANSWEICLKIKENSSSNDACYPIGSNKQYGITFSTRNSRLYLSSNGSSWDMTGSPSGINLPNNCYIRVRFTGTQYIYDYSLDKVTWTTINNITNSTKITSLLTELIVGKWFGDDYYFNGSIDLNNSYIKLGSTKYKLQAVVGYTIVGSPTIVDGVMTNITSSNTVRVNTPIGNNWNSLEFNIKAKVSDLGGGHYGNIFGQSYYLLFRVEGSKYNLWYRIDGNSNWVTKATNVVISESSLYEINLKIKNDGKFVFSLYDNNGSLLDSLIFVDADNLPIFNNNLTYGLLNGNITVNEIDLNSTYIKINNKLWFNGQQA